MRGMESLVAEPGRHQRPPGELKPLRKPEQLRVLKPSSTPLDAHRLAVDQQRRDMSAPHANRRMVDPTSALAARRAFQREHDLLRLDALLAEPTMVEHARRLVKVGQWQERLHEHLPDHDAGLSRLSRLVP